MVLDRTKAIELLHRYIKSDSLRSHALAVEAVMRHFAAMNGEDVDYWGIVGLMHDIDYEMYPDKHCEKAAEILGGEGFDEAFVHAVVSHGWGICCDVEPALKMEKILYATDELTGLITACVYMRPSRSVLDLELKSVKKKYKAKGFAAGVDRGIVEKGAALLGVTVDELIWQTILGMRCNAAEIGLAGELG